ncbi:hypothetical protein BD560DRAFT_345582 [Blakeslea trispora]|nr:hypothetical protein BD560DRAFT_345582 [Blakeslea trispora]
MFTLSHLPIEILYLVVDYLDTEDVVLLARLNSWYSYWLSFVLGERMHRFIDQDGWRVHIDILAKSYPANRDNQPTCPFSNELLLLSSYTRIHPVTLMIELKLYPVDQNGIDTAYRPSEPFVLLEEIKTNIDIVAYVTQISSDKRLQYVHQAGTAILSDHQILKSHDTKPRVVLATDFQVRYEVHQDDTEIPTKALLSFGDIQVTPEWWVKQMKKPFNSSPTLVEHQFW